VSNSQVDGALFVASALWARRHIRLDG